MVKSIDEMIAVMQAFKEGKEIEACYIGGLKWDVVRPGWNWVHLDYRVKEEVKTPDYIDWAHVASEFKYMARDEDGRVFLYTSKPMLMNSCWEVTCKIIPANIFQSLKIGDVDWKDSLMERDGNAS